MLRICGVFEWGPLETATPVIDFEHFRSIYGPGKGYLAAYESAVQIFQWFLGKGRKVIVNRVTKKTAGATSAVKATKTAQTGATAATKGSVTGTNAAPYALVTGDTLVGSVDGEANQTATFTAAAALRECANAETYALSDGMTLTVKVDQGSVQTITFDTAEFVDIANATAEEVAAVISAEITGAQVSVTSAGTKVTITSDTQGTGSYIEVTGGTANTALGFVTSEVQGTGNVASIAAVTIAEISTIVEAAWTNGGGVLVTDVSGYPKIEAQTAGSSGSVQVIASSTADDEFGLDNATHSGSDGAAQDTITINGKYYGAMGNQLTYTIADATSGVASEFDFAISLYGVLKYTWRNLTMDSTAARYAIDIVNSSNERGELIAVVDESATGTATQIRPANAADQALTGGDDGLTSITDIDFYGQDQYGDGFYAFDQNPDGDILACPDRATTTTQEQMRYMCETHWQGKCLMFPDPPDDSDKAAMDTHMASLGTTDYGAAMPWPNVKTPNPDKSIYGAEDTITIGPAVSHAARMVRNSFEFEDGPFHQPGNQIYGLLTNVVGLEGETDEVKHEVRKLSTQEFVTDLRINPVLAGRKVDRGFGVWVNDVQSLNPTSDLWASIGEAYGIIYLRRIVEAYLETRRTQGNSYESRATDQDVISGEMVKWTVRGAFATKNAAEAFYVNTDPKGEGINNPLEQDAGRYHVEIGVATQRPARFIDLAFTRDKRAVESYIQSKLALP
jgi:hypothetical protein